MTTRIIKKIITKTAKLLKTSFNLDEYNSLKETSYLLSGKNRDVLMQSIKESKTGKSESHNLIEE